jgi:hypothetical protein
MSDDDERMLERYRYSRDILILRQQRDANRDRLPLNQRKAKPVGRPPGSSVDYAHLQQTVDRLRRDTQNRPSKKFLAEQANYPRTTLMRYFVSHPEAWEALRFRWLEGR